MSEHALKKSAKHIFKQFLFFNDFKNFSKKSDHTLGHSTYLLKKKKLSIHILFKSIY